MIKLKHYELDFKSAFDYVKSTLEQVNTLSIELLKILDLKDGHFFSLLPDVVDIHMINNFHWGGVGTKQHRIQDQVKEFIL